MENAQIQLNFESTNISKEIERIVSNLNYDQRMEMLLDKEIEIKIDRFYFQSIIQNLIENAAKYSHADSQITINLLRNGKFARIEVVDEGVGLNAEEKMRVFDMYQRLENEEVKESKGTGLGLYIVNQLVRGHKGKILVEDNPKGKGTVFSVLLPLT